MATNGVAIFPLSNSVAFSPAANNGLTVIRQDTYKNNIQDWQAALPYAQKILDGDALTILVHTQAWFGETYPGLYICDHNKGEIGDTNLMEAPYLKGAQEVTGFTDPVTGAITDLISTMYSFSFSDFAAQIPNGGVFFLRLDNIVTDPVTGDYVTTLSYYSEPLLVSNTHPDTQLYQFSYNTNNAAKNIIVSGWWNDIGTDTIPYSPVFGIRAEGYVIPSMSGPKGINIGYFQQGYDPVQVKTQQKRFFDLHLGDVSLGVPWYMLEMITEALMADNAAIVNMGDSNAYAYVLYNAGSSSSLTDIWKVRGSDVSPLLYASCNVMQRTDAQAAFITPTPIPIGGRVFDGSFDGVFA